MQFQKVLESITIPTLMVDEITARLNIQTMAEKAARLGVRFRPHFKTHQSWIIGEWFREAGVSQITVSSFSMAEYFTAYGWTDILVAFPINWRELDTIQRLASTIHLGVLVDNPESAAFVANSLTQAIDVWIKVDSGLGRAGVHWQNAANLMEIIKILGKSPFLTIRGLLTHAGHTYHAGSVDEIQDIARDSIRRLAELRRHVKDSIKLDISIGDTPGCTLLDTFDGVDEIRPGNFIFYDASMLRLGVCQPEEIAVRLVCPVVGKYPDEGKLILYGGAVHLSKEALHVDGKPIYGWISQASENGWGLPLQQIPIYSVSQEHSVAMVPGNIFKGNNIGDLVGVVPVHSCLSVSAMGEYLTHDGKRIPSLRGWLTSRK